MFQSNQDVSYSRSGRNRGIVLYATQRSQREKPRLNFWLGCVLALVGIATCAPALGVRPVNRVSAPTVSITSPATATTVAGLVAVGVSASSSVGVARVDLLVNGTKIASSTTSPYAFSWDSTKVANGSATLAATAYDTSARSSTASISVTVANSIVDTQAPTVTIGSPTAGSTLKGTVAVSMSASDNVRVTHIDLYANNVMMGSVTTSPYTFSWNTSAVPDGSVTLKAVVYDAANNHTNSAVNVTVANTTTLDTQAPVVSLTSPAAGSTLSSIVSLKASASDNVGVARVDFLANGTKLGSSTTAPYTFSWDTTKVSDGSAIISASAYDAAGNSTTASMNANISNAPAPAPSQPTLTVTSANPAAGVSVRVYPADLSGSGDGAASFTRTYNANARVWVSAALRAGSNYFVKWQKDGVDYGTASTTSVVVDNNHTLTAVYETPSCSGVAVYPGIDSLKNAVAAYPAGTTYCIKAGIHRMNSQVLARTNDKYIGESGAILNGSKVLTSFVQSGSYWVATGQTQQEPPFGAIGSNGWPVCSAGAPACIYPEMVFLDGQDLWQVTSLADLAPGRFYFDYASDLIYLADNPTGHLVEATTGSGGLVGNTDGSSDSVTVKNLVFEKFGGGEVSLYAHNALKAVTGWRTENNEFRLISFMAVANFGNGVLRNNYIHHNGRLGIVGNGTIEGNVISYTNTHGWEAGTNAGSTKFHGTNGLVLRGNIVANNASKGLWVDFDNINVTYENNVVENNSLMGILHEVSCAAVIRYNVLRGNNSANAGRSLSTGAQLFTRSSKDLDIYGNDVTATSSAVHGIGVYGDFINGQPQTYTGTNCGTILMQNIQVHDNVVRLDVGQRNGNPWGASYSSVYFSNNTYFLKDLTGPHFHYNGGAWAKDQYQAAGGDVTGKFYQW